MSLLSEFLGYVQTSTTMIYALFTLTAPLFAILGIQAIPFGAYVALKCIFSAILGGGITALELYLGMIAAR